MQIFAGHIVLMSIIGLMFIFKSWLEVVCHRIVILCLYLKFSSFFTSYIFTMLSALYFGSAVQEHHHEEGH
jgi:F-type H+-transporting ATPase subunit a